MTPGSNLGDTELGSLVLGTGAGASTPVPPQSPNHSEFVPLVGPMVDTHDVENAVTLTITTWIDTYLAAKERAKRITIGSIARPASYNAGYDYDNWPEGQLPSIVVVCPGTAAHPEYHGDGTISAWFDVTVDAIVSDQTEKLARSRAAMYQAAVSLLITQQGNLNPGGDPFAADIRFEGWTLELPDVTNRTLAVGSSKFLVYVDPIFAAGGPSVVPTPPTDDVLYPVAETTGLNIVGVPLKSTVD